MGDRLNLIDLRLCAKRSFIYMFRSRIYLILLICFLGMPLVAFGAMGGGKMLKAGSDAPKVEFTDINGKKGTLHSFAQDKPLLLVFLQTACRSCQREMAFLKQLKEDGADIDVLVVFVDMKERNFKKYVSDNELPFVFFWDSDYSIAEQFGVSFTPSSFLMDKTRKIAKVYRGWSRAGHSLEGDFKKLAEQ